MALETAKIKLPRSVVTTLINKAKDSSVIAALSPSQPQTFSDTDYMIFNPSSEAEVVGEGAKKGSYEQKLTPKVGTRFKVVTTTRVSSELKWADEDNRLEILTNIQKDQNAAMGRALDYVVLHAVNPKDGASLPGYTGLCSQAKAVTSTDDEVANIDLLTDALDEYDITGFALCRPYASALRKLRVPATGQRLYPEIPLNLAVGSLDGIPAAVSGTVNGRLCSEETGVRAIMGDFGLIKWGMVRDVYSEIIEYGDPDGSGVDLKNANQIAFRTEAMYAYAVLDTSGFAVLKEAE